MDWQPIDTAPKDGTEVFLYGPSYHLEYERWVKPAYMVGSYDGPNGWMEGYEWVSSGIVADQRINPTHWMPLPEPPK